MAERIKAPVVVPRPVEGSEPATVPERPRPEAIPAGALLVARRYDGVGKQVERVPSCWCCAEPWRLERVQDRRDKTYAFLGPPCECLDRSQAVACCGLCAGHCTCQRGSPEGRGGEVARRAF